jgi:hypothetical protein
MNKEEILQLLINIIRFIEKLKPQDMLKDDIKNKFQNNYNVLNNACKTLSSDDVNWINNQYSKWLNENILNDPKYKDIKAYPLSLDYLKKELNKIQKI